MNEAAERMADAAALVSLALDEDAPLDVHAAGAVLAGMDVRDAQVTALAAASVAAAMVRILAHTLDEDPVECWQQAALALASESAP